jgi:PelA/Pel-15E family pectate lyase
MLANLANALRLPLPVAAATFTDRTSIADWALGSVGLVQRAGIMSGVGDNRFDPRGSYTREQSIATVMRVYNSCLSAALVSQNPYMPSYSLDFSGIPLAYQLGENRLTGFTLLALVPGAVTTVSSHATIPNLRWVTSGGTFRTGAMGVGMEGNGQVDTNGPNRRLMTDTPLEGAITVVITGGSWTDPHAAFTLSYGEQSVNLTIGPALGTIHHTFEHGSGPVGITHWPWDGGGRADTGRLSLQRIEIYEHGDEPHNFTGQFPEITNELIFWGNSFHRVIFTAGSPQMKINGQVRDVDISGAVPFTDGDELWVPYDAAVRALGTSVNWAVGNESITARAGTASQNVIYRRIDGVIYVPLRLLAGRLGIGSTGWDEATGMLIVSTGAVQQGTVMYANLNRAAESWYGSQSSIIVADNLIMLQRNNGGWPRGIGQDQYPTTQQPWASSNIEAHTAEQLARSYSQRHLIDSYFGRGITTHETRFMLRMYEATGIERFKQSGMRGLNAILDAQYQNGGWPYYVTDRSGQRGQVSFEDDAFIEIMRLINDIRNGAFPSVDGVTLARVEDSFDKGIGAIVNLQIKSSAFADGIERPTAWAQRHHPVTGVPTQGRLWEIPSISGSESVDVIRFLMSLPNPDERIVNAVHSAVYFFEYVEIFGFTHVTNTLTPDPAARGLWARFICINTFNPLHYSRNGRYANVYNTDGSIDILASYHSFDETGYMYFSQRGATLPALYTQWKVRNGIG